MKVFICHTSADKPTVVRPLADSLPKTIECWIDENEILWGDSVSEKVNAALQKSDFVIVVLSADFIEMNWPQRELHAVLNIEAASGIPKILPLVVGDAADRARIIEKYPLLNDKLYLKWPEDNVQIIDHITKLAQRTGGQQAELDPIDNASASPSPEVYIPTMQPGNPTDKEKHDFLKNGFSSIQQYFEAGVPQLNNSSSALVVELELINNKKFVARIFRNGSQVSGCKVWLGGMFSSNNIMYSDGADRPDDDSSFNDMLSIEQSELAWKAMSPTAALSGTNGLMSHQQASEYLWKKFVQPLEWN